MNILHKIKNWLIVLVFGVSVYAYSGTQGGTLPNEKSVNIEELLQNKTAKEKAQIKSEKISKIKLGKFTKNDLRIEVIGEITAIEINGQYGIEFFAKAWKNGKQLGFGKDGTVEIERFRIYNPPVLVDDINGDIVREWNDIDTNEIKQRKLRYDPTEATRQSLAHIISLVGKDGKNIIEGKIGNTTSTFYATTGDGSIYSYSNTGTPSDETWAAARDSTEVGVSDIYDDSTTQYATFARGRTASGNYTIIRSYFAFDTSAIGGDTVDSGTFSIYGFAKNDALTNSITLVEGTQASTSELVTTDIDNLGETELSTARMAISAFSTSAYNDFTLNASGEAHINKAGYTKFAVRDGDNDLDDVAPPKDNTNSYTQCYFADQTGTANDPKLVVEHSAGVTFTPRAIIF